MDITTLAESFGGFAYVLIFFVIAISIIVAIHEYGHYIVGRWCGIHAEVFSLGMGPEIYSRVDKRGTKWQIAALPFGGYVKFLGDANAASIGANSDVPSARNTMPGAPLWARAATVAAGPIFNFILAAVMFAFIVMGRGQATDPLTVDTISTLPPSFEQELQSGDVILAINGLETPAPADFDGYIDQLPVEPTLDYRIRRDGDEMVVQGRYPYLASVVALSPDSAAYDIDMKVGDVITHIDGTPIFTFEELLETVMASEGRVLDLKVYRDGEILDFALAPRVRDMPIDDGEFERRYMIGISGGLYFDPATETVGVFSALWNGVQHVWAVIATSISGLGKIITGAISACNLSGPIGIAKASGAMASQGTVSFIWFVGILSVAVGFLNLFPVPILDGGHLVFHAYEAVSGKPPSEKALRILMMVGLAIVFSLMVFAITNDLFCP